MRSGPARGSSSPNAPWWPGESYGYINCPGIFNDEQEASWKQVVSAVHQAGARIFLQLWHAGRVSHPDLQEIGADPLAPSAESGPLNQPDPRTFYGVGEDGLERGYTDYPTLDAL